jgi:hypothetical protein
MNLLPVLLADFEVVKSMSNRFHGKQAQLHTSDLMMGLGLLSILVLVAWGLARLTRKGDDRPSYHSNRSLFRELCRAHGIERAGRALLQKLAKSRDLPPAQLFLDPDCWQPEKLDPQWAPAANHFQALHDRLFAIVDEAEAAEAEAAEAETTTAEPAEAAQQPDDAALPGTADAS